IVLNRCNVTTGFFCVNAEQTDSSCQDYRIRFVCPESFCGGTVPLVSSCLTEWFDRDNPSGKGDYETISHLRKEFPGSICAEPIACEVETTSGIPALQTGENIRRCNVSTGFFCVNADQSDRRCEDYRIRFVCPVSFCNCKTQWFDRDDPTGHGDYEDLTNLRNEYPGLICSNPIACEVETLSGIPVSSTGDAVSSCNVISGFTCVNAEQNDGTCEDYRIRFICPESFCNCKTQWFDRDDPTGFGDYEDLTNLQNEYPGHICLNPIACEVETLSGIPVASTGDVVSRCNVNSGFACVNAEQSDGKCEDYRIRFICPDSFCNCKTQWFDRDDPTGFGDYEHLTHLRNEYPGRICSNPVACEVETLSGIPVSSTGDAVSSCNVMSGFVCVNAEQSDGKCEDYRIRFTCPDSFCNCKTQWFDRDDVSGKGDFETLVNLQKEYPDQICSNPTACEVETLSGIPASDTGENIAPCSITTGFTCVNEEQIDGVCEDYRIRFTCPESFCSCFTRWFDRDDPTGKGDFEDLVNLRKAYPAQICSNPSACEVQTISGIPASNTGNNIPPCSVSTGFSCINAEQANGKCEDYRIRFTCPESFCDCKTQWFDRDGPSGNGDYEILVNLRKENPNKICSHPTACEVETTDGLPASSTGDVIPECDLSNGFICVNAEQGNNSCRDYRIRFTCPRTFCDKNTQWFDHDDPSGQGDFEDLQNLRKAYPNQICSKPTACEVQTISGKPASSTDDIIPECNILTGFVCLNNDQINGSCEDYKIRFTCP
ncbi:mucin-5AC, partial [Narcine bancroftii]|uniref:mucin-5AC n=1 Tax=Narcine bancroftii TaxID=1343680 RepID=UPI003831F888